jgi:hypothetical protein
MWGTGIAAGLSPQCRPLLWARESASRRTRRAAGAPVPLGCTCDSKGAPVVSGCTCGIQACLWQLRCAPWFKLCAYQVHLASTGAPTGRIWHMDHRTPDALLCRLSALKPTFPATMQSKSRESGGGAGRPVRRRRAGRPSPRSTPVPTPPAPR